MTNLMNTFPYAELTQANLLLRFCLSLKCFIQFIIPHLEEKDGLFHTLLIVPLALLFTLNFPVYVHAFFSQLHLCLFEEFLSLKVIDSSQTQA